MRETLRKLEEGRTITEAAASMEDMLRDVALQFVTRTFGVLRKIGNPLFWSLDEGDKWVWGVGRKSKGDRHGVMMFDFAPASSNSVEKFMLSLNWLDADGGVEDDASVDIDTAQFTPEWVARQVDAFYQKHA